MRGVLVCVCAVVAGLLQQTCFLAACPSGPAKDAMMRTKRNRQAMMMEEEETVVVGDLIRACRSLPG